MTAGLFKQAEAAAARWFCLDKLQAQATEGGGEEAGRAPLVPS